MAVFWSNMFKFAVPMGLFIWSLLQPSIASYVFVGLTIAFEACLFFIDIAYRPKPSPLSLTADADKIERDHHLALRSPYTARDISLLLNGIRWSSLIWIPWMAWNHLWIPAGFLAINFFFVSPLAIRLDPFYFYSAAVKNGHGGAQRHFAKQLAILQDAREQMDGKASLQMCSADPSVEAKILELIDYNCQNGKFVPKEILAIPELPFSNYEDLRADVILGKVLLQRFAFAYPTDLYDILATPFESKLLSIYGSLYLIMSFGVPLATIIIAIFHSWWWLLGILICPFSISFFIPRMRTTYNHVILRLAMQSEPIFCFLYCIRQVHIVTADLEKDYYWKGDES